MSKIAIEQIDTKVPPQAPAQPLAKPSLYQIMPQPRSYETAWLALAAIVAALGGYFTLSQFWN